MLKASGAVIVGFITWTILFLGSNSLISSLSPGSFNPDGSTDSSAMLLLILILSILFSLVSGYLCSRIAQHKALGACLSLSILLLAVGLIVQLQYWNIMPIWYHLSFLAALVPATLGGHILAKQ